MGENEQSEDDAVFPKLMAEASSAPAGPVGRVRVVVVGEIVDVTVERFLRVARTWLDDSDTLELDLSGVSFMDSTGLLALVDVWIARRPEQRVVVHDASPQVRRLIELTGLEDLLGLR